MTEMNVKVGAQIFSSSVANFIQCLMLADHPGSEDAHGTTIGCFSSKTQTSVKTQMLVSALEHPNHACVSFLESYS